MQSRKSLLITVLIERNRTKQPYKPINLRTKQPYKSINLMQMLPSIFFQNIVAYSFNLLFAWFVTFIQSHALSSDLM